MITVATSNYARRVEPLMADTQALFLVKEHLAKYGPSDISDRVLSRLVLCRNEAIANEARRLWQP